MRNKAGIAFAAVGAVLLLSALLLFVHNRAEAAAAAREAETLVASLEQQIAAPASTPEETENTEPEASPTPAAEETAAPGASPTSAAETQTCSESAAYVDTSSLDYLGILEIPALDVKLPVINTMSDALLEYGACRHFGSVETNDLVIAAHSYPQFFGYLGNLPGGSEVILTEMDGTEIRYTLTDMAKIAPDDAEAALNSGYDLVLYTCYDSGYGRVAAYFTRSE